MSNWPMMVSEEALFLREATGTSAVAEAARAVELIIRRKLSRDLAIQQAARGIYQETWDALRAEK